MRTSHHMSRQRGAALIIGMILLAIITLLAVVGMNVSTSELQAASAEQLRVRAVQAAEVGIERGVIVEMPQINNDECVDKNIPTAQVLGGDPNDRYTLTGRFRGEIQLTDDFSQDYSSFHYSVISIGTAPRNTRRQHVQGAYFVNNTGNQQSFAPLAANLLQVACP
jgi:Tfp pilus assembly protein PilX